MSKKFYDQLKQFDILPKKKLGQNFLVDKNIINKIASIVKGFEDKHILEIGPGVACLSSVILEQKPKNFSCVEYDKKCVEFLKEKILPQYPHMKIFYEDALKFDEKQLITENDKLTLIANLPYNIASVLLIKWLEKIDLFEELVLMFQKEVAERICAPVSTKKYGILSVLSQYLCDCHIEFNISPTCFFPAPKVESSIVVLRPKHDMKDRLLIFPELKSVVKTMFNMRRKTILNNLKSLTKNPEDILEKANLSKELRPENLSFTDFVTLTKTLA